ncbi:MAG: type II toxin-antitoxin system VapC family toxin [Ignavibacterium sp.]|nr:type II toxin-antitoxin system VapC family toxin [Ignavibacterium sp.]MDW8374981.1 type II toxin-antitoxin system VapC family toxin [Ignavibacteriales bacterium]
MSNKNLVDTNIFIYYLKDDEVVTSLLKEEFISENKIFYSIINEIELLSFPKLSSDESLVIKNFLSCFSRVYISDNIINRTIEIKRKHNLNLGDSIIAATALELEAILVARNEKDFSKIIEIKIFNPFSKDANY